MKLILSIVLMTAVASSCTLSDLRPLRLQVEGPAAIDAEKGSLMLKQWQERINPENKPLPKLEFQATDTWPSFFTRTFNMPWPQSPQLIRVEISPREQWVSYKHDNVEQKITFTSFKNQDYLETAHWLRLIYSFMVPSYSLAKGKIITYAGDAAAAGKSFYLVLVTGGSLKPNKENDQYMLWINQQTGIAEYIQYTMRAVKPFIYGTIEMSDFRQIDGRQMPFRLRVLDYPGSDYVIRDTVIGDLQTIE